VLNFHSTTTSLILIPSQNLQFLSTMGHTAFILPNVRTPGTAKDSAFFLFARADGPWLLQFINLGAGSGLNFGVALQGYEAQYRQSNRATAKRALKHHTLLAHPLLSLFSTFAVCSFALSR